MGKRTEISAVSYVLRNLHTAGWMPIEVDNGDGYEPVANSVKALDAIDGVEEAYLRVKKGDETRWIQFVFGNGPAEIVCDHSYPVEADGQTLKEFAVLMDRITEDMELFA